MRGGLTDAEYASLLSVQGGVCGVCREPFGDRTPHVDHDHALERAGWPLRNCARGIIHHGCNLLVGRCEAGRAVNATEDQLRAVSEYLARGVAFPPAPGEEPGDPVRVKPFLSTRELCARWQSDSRTVKSTMAGLGYESVPWGKTGRAWRLAEVEHAERGVPANDVRGEVDVIAEVLGCTREEAIDAIRRAMCAPSILRQLGAEVRSLRR